MSNTEPTACTDHGKFVAHARQHIAHYAPVLKWMRNNPDWDEWQWRRWDRAIELHIDDAWDGHEARTVVEVIRKGSALRERFYPATITQAIDVLIDVKVLPGEFHSLAPKPKCEHRDLIGSVCGDEALGGTDRCELHTFKSKCGEPCKHGGSCTLLPNHDGAHSASGLCSWYTPTAVAS